MASEDRHADVALVADAIGLSCTETNSLLQELETAGLVDAERVRLTLGGLTIAVSSGGAARHTPRTQPTPVRAQRPASSRAA